MFIYHLRLYVRNKTNVLHLYLTLQKHIYPEENHQLEHQTLSIYGFNTKSDGVIISVFIFITNANDAVT